MFLLSLATPFFENLQECNTLVEGSRVVQYRTGNVLYIFSPLYQSQVTPINTCLPRRELANHAPSPEHPAHLYGKSCAILTKKHIACISCMGSAHLWVEEDSSPGRVSDNISRQMYAALHCTVNTLQAPDIIAGSYKFNGQLKVNLHFFDCQAPEVR